MPKITTGFVFAIASMVFLGVGNFLYKKSTQELGPTHTTFFYYLFSIILTSALWFLVKEKPPVVKGALIWPALMAVFISASVWCFSYSLKTLDVSIASTVRGLAFLATIVLAILFYKEQLSAKDVVAVLLAIGAVVLFGVDFNRVFK